MKSEVCRNTRVFRSIVCSIEALLVSISVGAGRHGAVKADGGDGCLWGSSYCWAFPFTASLISSAVWGVPADVNVLCDKRTLLGDIIKGTACRSATDR